PDRRDGAVDFALRISRIGRKIDQRGRRRLGVGALPPVLGEARQRGAVAVVAFGDVALAAHRMSDERMSLMILDRIIPIDMRAVVAQRREDQLLEVADLRGTSWPQRRARACRRPRDRAALRSFPPAAASYATGDRKAPR